jgi:hypothetical protein
MTEQQMGITNRTYDDIADRPVDVPDIEVQTVLQRWVAERLEWLRAQTLELSASKPAEFLQRAVVPPKRILKAADPRELFRSISHTSVQIGSRLTKLASTTLPRVAAPTSPDASPASAPTTLAASAFSATAAATDKMRAYWKARVDVLHKMLEKKPEP